MNITDRKFGIEIEFVGATRDEVNQLVNSKGVRCRVEGYNHTTKTHWKIVTDASVYGGGEIVSPILQGQEGLNQLKKVCDALQEAGATVNVSCGLHVHLDARDLTVKEIGTIYDRYAKYEEQIDLCLPRSRRNSRWCESTKTYANSVKQATTKSAQADVTGRYRKINLTNLGTTGSLEFRQHSGTIEFRKIGHWLAFLMQFVAKSQRVANGSRPNVSEIARKAFFGPLRKELQNFGYDLTHVRGGSKWRLQHLASGQVRLIEYTEIKRFTLALAVARTGNDIDTVSERYKFYLKRFQIEQSEVIEFIQTYFVDHTANQIQMGAFGQQQEGEQDNGWLDGVDTHTAEWLNQRQQELN